MSSFTHFLFDDGFTTALMRQLLHKMNDDGAGRQVLPTGNHGNVGDHGIPQEAGWVRNQSGFMSGQRAQGLMYVWPFFLVYRINPIFSRYAIQ
jgi:hypothetical protein